MAPIKFRFMHIVKQAEGQIDPFRTTYFTQEDETVSNPNFRRFEERVLGSLKEHICLQDTAGVMTKEDITLGLLLPENGQYSGTHPKDLHELALQSMESFQDVFSADDHDHQ
jgi:hypothetical protein